MDDFTRLQLLPVPVEPDLAARFDEFVKESRKLTPEELAARLKREGAKVRPEPSEAQKEEGNYRKGHVPWKGLEISIETAKGQYRRGVSDDGKPWAARMADHYGYLRGTKSDADGDVVDVFVCEDHPHSDIVFVVNQRKPDGTFDEHKVILGTVDVESAKKVYLRNYEEGWQGMGEVTPMTVDHFKWWLANADTSKEIKNGYFASPGNLKKAACDPTTGEEKQAHGHFRAVCRACDRVYLQCRCRGPKEARYGTCPECSKSGFEDDDAEKLAADDALGIPDRSNFGDLSKLKPGDLTDFVVQHHHAEKAGPHFDMRLGTPETGLYSWATRHELPRPGEKRLWVQQPLHSHDYGDFEGEIPEGYGKGTVKKHARRQIMLTKVGPGEIHFTTADRRHPERFALVQTRDRHWLMLNTTPTEPLPYQKIHYAKIPGQRVEETLRKLQPGSSVQAKVDGASSLVRLLKDGVELVSYRAAKETGHPIIHTERFFQGARPRLNVPPELVGTVLRGELYGVKNQGDKEESIHPSELGGVLNATLANSLAAQKAKGIRLKNMLFDVQQHGKTPVDLRHTPYSERRRMLEEVLQKVPLERFHLPDEVHDPDQAVKLWQDITSGKHPVTREGVVIHPHTGKPMKAKPRPDFDVHLTGIFPGEGKYQGSGAGGFTYSLHPGGPTVGRVGTGLSDEMRRELLADPGSYLGRVARITAQEQLPSGAYRAPSFIAFHEDYPQHKQASDGYVPRLVLVKRAKDDESPFTIAVDLDGTLAEKEEPFNPRTIGKPRPRALYWLRLFHAAGARIIIFTVRGDNDLVEDWLDEHDVPYHYVNENPDQPEDSSGKIIADAYWDDRGYNAEDPDEHGPLLLEKILAHGQDAEEGEEEKGPADGPARVVVSVHKTLVIAAPDVLQALEADHEQGSDE